MSRVMRREFDAGSPDPCESDMKSARASGKCPRGPDRGAEECCEGYTAVDGDGDRRADITNNADSIHSAANYLTRSGATLAPDGVRRALFAYNQADWYVNDVLHYAQAYGAGGLTGTSARCPSPSRR